MIAGTRAVTFDRVSGYEIVRSLGDVRGEGRCARDRMRATLRSLGVFIGMVRVEESPETQRARAASLEALMAHAEALGANGVVGLGFHAFEGRDGVVSVVATGTAVVLAPEPPR